MELGLDLAPPGSAQNRGAVVSVCMSVPSFQKGCRAHRDAALFCTCQGQDLMLVAELWHPLCCHAPEWLLPSLQSKGTWARNPCFHMPLLSQLWAQLCPTFTEVVRDQLWVYSGGSQLMAALCTLPSAESACAMLVPPGEHTDSPPELQAPAPTPWSCKRCLCCHKLLPWKLSHSHMLTSSHPGHLCSPSDTHFGADNANGQVFHSPAAGGNVARTAGAAGAGLWMQVDHSIAEGSC